MTYQLPTDCSWIKVIDKPITKGLEQHIIYLKTDKNDTPNQRNCEIIISNKASNIKRNDKNHSREWRLCTYS